MKVNVLENKLRRILPYLNEKQQRILAATEAISLGYGGVSKISKLTGMSRTTVHKGIEDLENKEHREMESIRLSGGGRKSTHFTNPKLRKLIESLVEDSTRGDPLSPLKWTAKSIREISECLNKKGQQISRETVRGILKDIGYSLQANDKTLEDSHPDRDEQFLCINKKVKMFLEEGQPVISVDTKKKERIGNFGNKDKEWREKGSPGKVKMHDFHEGNQEVGIPYGIYDQANNLGWVSVGCDHDTSAFAVQSIQLWWNTMGRHLYPDAGKLLICADGGGSNGYRARMWKYKLQECVNKTGLEVTVCHFPKGTSKWNKIEHRLFSHISMNWKGQPLISHDVMVNLIGATKTKTGLQVKAKIDKRKYPTGIKLSDQDMAKINLKKDTFHGEWNYTILNSIK
ncbi:MAG TPA: ISAzo13 family transposase [Candidatus Brocadiaceae bacterium]